MHFLAETVGLGHTIKPIPLFNKEETPTTKWLRVDDNKIWAKTNQSTMKKQIAGAIPNIRQVWIQGKSIKRNRKCTFKLLNDGAQCTETLMVFNALIHTSYILGCTQKTYSIGSTEKTCSMLVKPTSYILGCIKKTYSEQETGIYLSQSAKTM